MTTDPIFGETKELYQDLSDFVDYMIELPNSDIFCKTNSYDGRVESKFKPILEAYIPHEKNEAGHYPTNEIHTKTLKILDFIIAEMPEDSEPKKEFKAKRDELQKLTAFFTTGKVQIKRRPI
jgi:hypothetical protein